MECRKVWACRHSACIKLLSKICTLVQTLASDGIRGLFKGMGAPLATVALFNAILFATRGQMEKILAHSDGELAAITLCSLFPELL